MGTELDALISKSNSKWGAGTIMRGSDIKQEMIPRCTSGCLSLDLALGGGWPMNQFSEVVGQESSGKSALVAKTIAANMARDKNWTAAWFDAEGSFDPVWFERMGVDNDRLYIVTDNSMEAVYETAIQFLDSRQVDCVVIDSLPALVPDAEDTATVEELQMGLGARVTNKFFRKNRGAVRRSLIEVERPVLAIVINQWREKIGVMWGDPRTTPGGKGKNFACVIRLDVKHDDWIEHKGVRVGQTIKFNCIKNKTAPPRRTAEVDFYFDDSDVLTAGSYDMLKDVVNIGVLNGVIHQGGKYFWIGENVAPGDKWKSRAEMYEAIRSDTDLYDTIRAEVLGLAPPPKRRQVVRRK